LGSEYELPIAVSQRIELGWGFVFQDLSLLPSTRVADSFLTEGFHASRRFWVNDRAEIAWIQAALDILGVAVDAAAPMESLSPAEQAMVAIARAAVRVEGLGLGSQEGRGLTEDESKRDINRAGLLVLDEPTALLPGDEAELVYGLVRRVQARGHGVILVSHHLNEIVALADRVTVLADGEVAGVAGLERGDVTHAQLVEMMLGGGARAARYARATTQSSSSVVPTASTRRSQGDPAVQTLVVTGMSGRRVEGIDFSLAKGEILGLTGIVGAGHEEVPYLLFGARRWQSGFFMLQEKRVDTGNWDIPDAVAAGMALVPADRADSGVMDMSVQANLTLPSISEFSRLSLINRPAERNEAQIYIRDLGVKTEGPGATLRSLSGGNQQKISLAKWLRRQPVVLLLHEPTQGVDVGARAEIQQTIRTASEQGMSVLWASNDFDELAEVCHRVLVIGAGKIRSEVRPPLTPDRLGEECLMAESM